MIHKIQLITFKFVSETFIPPISSEKKISRKIK